MYIVCIILILLASVLVILSVLAQNPKSGMAANFGASNQVMGVRQTTSFLEKFTWTLALAILVLSLAATMTMPSSRIAASKSGVEKAIEESIEANDLFAPEMFGTPAAGDSTGTGSAAAGDSSMQMPAAQPAAE